MIRKSLTILLIILINAFTSAQNVMISNMNNPNEPSIMIDPNNTNTLVAGANLDNVYYSWDSGTTWTEKKLTSSFHVWGDPVIDVDNKGNFYFFHLSNKWGQDDWLDRIVCQKSITKGESWNDGSSIGHDGEKQHDKQWSIIDQKTNNIYVVWTVFDEVFSKNPDDRTNILFSKSVDGGENWSKAKIINAFDGDCNDLGLSVQGAVPALGPNGELYVTWTGPKGLMFQRSLDDGETWLEEEKTLIPFPNNGWKFNIPGIYRSYGLPVIKCDLSGGKNNGTIYINWYDQSNGSDDSDVWLIKSKNGGNTWTEKIRVNDDGPGKHQFCTWMDIDQTNGNLHFVFYDRRNSDSKLTDVYGAYSTNGGETIINKQISEGSAFDPVASVFFGDYINISAHDNVVRPIWTRLDGPELSIWTDITPFDATLSVDDKVVINNKINFYPNPVSGTRAYVSFKLRRATMIDLQLYDKMGNHLRNIIDNKEFGYGKHIIEVDFPSLNLKPGFYFYKLSFDGKAKGKKVLILR